MLDNERSIRSVKLHVDDVALPGAENHHPENDCLRMRRQFVQALLIAESRTNDGPGSGRSMPFSLESRFDAFLEFLGEDIHLGLVEPAVVEAPDFMNVQAALGQG